MQPLRNNGGERGRPLLSKTVKSMRTEGWNGTQDVDTGGNLALHLAA